MKHLNTEPAAWFSRSEAGWVITDENLNRYLLATEGYPEPEAERLCRLAIALDHEAVRGGWWRQRHIYRRAQAHSSNDSAVVHAMGISALSCIEETASATERNAIAEDIEETLLAACAGKSDCIALFEVLGLIYYEHPNRAGREEHYLDLAIGVFLKALAHDPERAQSLLYLAHCFHDLKRWNLAYAAYCQVDTEQLLRDNPHARWQVLKTEEQLALCAARLGKTKEATERFQHLAGRILDLDEDARCDEVVNVDEMMEAVVNVLHDRALSKSAVEVVDALDLGDRYRHRYAPWFASMNIPENRGR